jgi:DegV family protein with EDD domain
MLRIVTDGAADVPLEWQKEFDIQVVPVNIQFGDKTYIQWVELSQDDFYRLVDENKKVPTTSQPTPYQFAEFYKKVANAGDTILSIHPSSKLSGTLNSATTAAQDLAHVITITTFDSLSGSAAIGILCREARLLERAGKTIEEIVTHLEKMRSNIGVVLTLDTLEYARLSGRVSTLQTAFSSLLNVKPIATVTDGLINIIEKARTRRASIQRVLEIVKEKVGDRAVSMAIVHARDPQAGAMLMERACETFNIRDIVLTDLSLSIASNLGPGTVGIIFYPVE